MMNIDALTRKISAIVASHELENGGYARWLWQDKAGDRQLGLNEYGVADAVNILYTIGAFPTGERRQAICAKLQSLQNRTTGLFTEATHHPIHTTAHCVAALELFDARPLYPLSALCQYYSEDGLYKLLNSLDWLKRPWPQSHQGAGIYAAAVIAGEVDLAWQHSYFRWIWEHTDPKYGLSLNGTIEAGSAPLCEHLFGWFHYTFNTEYARQPMRYPERMIDSCLAMYEKNELGETFGRFVGFREIDWVFCMNRAIRQTTHRTDEVKAALLSFARSFIPWLDSLDPTSDDGMNDLHMLFGACCAVAELQRALPGEIESTIPWRLVLDRRPFI